MLIVHEKGESNFAGPGGVTVAHNFNFSGYIPDIIEIADSGAIGEVWITDIAVNSFVVRNSGSGISAFEWSIHVAIEYTTAALVRQSSKWLSPDLTNADIEEYISQAEGVIDSVMKKTGRGLGSDYTFDPQVQGVVRDAATSLALFNCIRYDPGCFPLLEQAEMAENLAYYSALRALTLLANIRIVDHVVKLGS
ncbi:capsid tail fiber [ANMV-1 virus]|nr:capsid tail fiber [ANMV-1 virus]